MSNVRIPSERERGLYVLYEEKIGEGSACIGKKAIEGLWVFLLGGFWEMLSSDSGKLNRPTGVAVSDADSVEPQCVAMRA